MTDRELLELAAQAAGIVGHWEKDAAYIQDRYYFNVPYDNQNMLTGFRWDPLTDDGDALRLAVKLDIDVLAGMDDDRVAITTRGTELIEASERLHGDSYAATRRAIVRAAAELAKNSPTQAQEKSA